MSETTGEALPIDQVKKELVSPRTISKRRDQEGRSAVVENVLQARTNLRRMDEAILKREGKTEEIGGAMAGKDELVVEKSVELAWRREALLVKLKVAIGLSDKEVDKLQTELDTIKKERIALSSDLKDLEEETKKLREEKAEIPNARALVESYYEKVKTQPLTNEEKRQLLMPEVLASLSTEEYIALWRRLNPYFLAHVTRQGFRDHTGGDFMVSHSSGYLEQTNGFTDVMENGRSLFPPLAKVGLIDRSEATVNSFLSGFLAEASNAEEAKKEFRIFLNRHLASAPKYPDITATHLAAQLVSDRYYGGERGNEVFFIYPSDILASQYAFAFNGREKDFTEPQSEIKWNDVFVWTDPNKPGVPVDSGIVFLPERTLVDPDIGSKYASEVRTVEGQKRRVLVEDANLVNSFVEWGKHLDDQSPAGKALSYYEKEYEKEKDYFYRERQFRNCLDVFSEELQKLGVISDVAGKLSLELISKLSSHSHNLTDEILLQTIRGVGANWKRAENAIPAKDYWENFFAKNPHLRPQHIQYYDGDPTNAVFAFQRKNDIGRADTSATEGSLLGFDDNHVEGMTHDPRANIGYDELINMADQIIEKHYENKEKAEVLTV